MIAELCNMDINGNISIKTFKRNKAKKIYDSLKSSIISDYVFKVKNGSKSNAGFRYGENKEIKNCKGEVKEIRRYAVDFNGKKELILR